MIHSILIALIILYLIWDKHHHKFELSKNTEGGFDFIHWTSFDCDGSSGGDILFTIGSKE